MAVAVRRPAHDSGMRKPDGAVFGRVAPSAIFIEIFISDSVVRNVTPGGRVIFSAVAFVGPALQVVIVAHSLDIGLQLVGAAEDASLVGMHSERFPTPGNFAFAIAHDHYRAVPRFIHLDSCNATT